MTVEYRHLPDGSAASAAFVPVQTHRAGLVETAPDRSEQRVHAPPLGVKVGTGHSPGRVIVGPFGVADARADDVLDVLRSAAVRAVAFHAFALHVGGLNARQDRDFVAAMETADLVYADGASIVLLARLAGARCIQRAPTTDLGWSLLESLRTDLGRPVRVALVGGVDGLSQRAGEVLSASLGVEVVACESGYQSDWDACVSRLAASECDVLFVGLGAPTEMKWVEQHGGSLPQCLVLTCGGWFGFVVSQEKRAPAWMQRRGLEWSFRLAQAPRRLGRRYARGAQVSLVVAAGILSRRGRTWVAPERVRV